MTSVSGLWLYSFIQSMWNDVLLQIFFKVETSEARNLCFKADPVLGTAGWNTPKMLHTVKLNSYFICLLSALELALLCVLGIGKSLGSSFFFLF